MKNSEQNGNHSLKQHHYEQNEKVARKTNILECL